MPVAVHQTRSVLSFEKIPFHQPMKEVNASVSHILFRLASVAKVSIATVFTKMWVHGIFLRLYSGKVYTWKLLFCLCQAAPCITS